MTGARDSGGELICVVAFGASAWILERNGCADEDEDAGLG